MAGRARPPGAARVAARLPRQPASRPGQRQVTELSQRVRDAGRWEHQVRALLDGRLGHAEHGR